MQSTQTKLFVDDNGKLFVFFYQNGTIYIKKLAEGNLSPSYAVAKDVLPSFSICVDKGKPLVITQKTSGDIYLCRQNKDKWIEKHFLRSSPDTSSKFYIYHDKGVSTILYDQPSKNPSVKRINAVTISNNSSSSPTMIDEIFPLSPSPFNTMAVTPFHLLLFYTDLSRRIVLREVYLSPFKTGSPLYITNEVTFSADISSIVFNDAIHIVYICRSRRSSQLIYKNKSAKGLSEGISIWENPRLKNCIIHTEKNRIYIYCTAGTNVFCSFSDNNGKSFCPVFKINIKLSPYTIKAEIINASSSSFCSTEAFINNDSHSIELPDVSFKDVTINPDKLQAQETGNFNDELERYKNKAILYEKQLNEANKKISELSKKLAQRNEELSVINSRWIKRLNDIKPSSDKKLPSVICETPHQ